MACTGTNDGGYGCADLATYWAGETAVCYITVDVAGDILCYRLQLARTLVADIDVAFSLQTKSGADYSYIDGSETGLLVEFFASGASGCKELEDGVDFPATSYSTLGDATEYVSCYFEDRLERAVSGGSGCAWFNNADKTTTAGWTPDGTDADGIAAIGVDITAAGGVEKSVAGSLTMSGEVSKKLMAKRTVSGVL